jgi:hypothetical protein
VYATLLYSFGLERAKRASIFRKRNPFMGTMHKAMANKYEFSALNKMEKSITDQMIKSLCWKIQVSTLGDVTNVNK